MRTGQPYKSGIGYTENRNKVAAVVNEKQTEREKFNTIEAAVDNGVLTLEQGEALLLEAGLDPTGKNLKDEALWMNGVSPINRAMRRL